MQRAAAYGLQYHAWCRLLLEHSLLMRTARAPVRHGDDAVRSDEPRLEDVHVLPANGVVQPEQLRVAPAHLPARAARLLLRLP